MLFTRKTVVVLMCCLSAGCSSKLTRNKAIDLIRHHDNFDEVLTFQVPVGTFCDSTQNAYSNMEALWLMYGARGPLKTIAGAWPGLFVDIDTRNVTSQVMNGPVPQECVPTVQALQRELGGGLGGLLIGSSYHFWRWTLKITPAGVKAGLPDRGGPVQIAQKVFMSMTGLADNADGTTTGEFTWRWVSTDLANALNMDKGFNVDVPGKATFKLYDDGWRISAIEASSPSPY